MSVSVSNAEKFAAKERTVHRQPVSSSRLQSVGYDPQGRILEIEFNHDGVYQYEGVGQEIYADLMAAPSKDVYFAERIRDVYAWRRVEEG